MHCSLYNKNCASGDDELVQVLATGRVEAGSAIGDELIQIGSNDQLPWRRYFFIR
jgi:hypothetical protein